MSSDQANFILAITSIITTVTLIITLGIVAWQTRKLGKQIQLSTLTSVSGHLKEVNGLLLHDEELAGLVGESRADALASIILGACELWFDLYEQHLVNRLWWHSAELTIDDLIRREFMISYWKRYKHQYYGNFGQYVDRKLQELGLDKKIPPTVSQQPVNKNTDAVSKVDTP